MASIKISDFYAAVCEEHQKEINPYVLQVLKETTLTKSVTLELSGNNRLRCVQRLDDKDVFSLSKCLIDSKHVTGLDFRYNNISDKGAGDLAELLQEESSSLKSLNLTFNDIQTDGAEVLAKSLQCNSTLLSLSLSGNKIGNRGAMHLASMLQVNHTLRELQLADCDLATQSVIAFAIMLKSNESLHSLDISRPQLLFSLQEEWTVHFSEMLAVNSSLVELHLGKTGMTDTGMERLSEGLRLNRSLRYLDLRCNRLTRDGVRHLTEVLKQNPSLEILDLSANRIEDEGALYLGDAISHRGCSLRELSVTSNNIKTEGLLSLSVAMRLNTSLSHIYIWGNHLEERVCQAFRELISSGRLPSAQTDVSAYEVDGRVFLAEMCHSLRRHYDGMDHCSDTESSSTPDTAADLLTEPADNTESTLTAQIRDQRVVPLQPLG
ncbi:leucine-rich repeat-containing protein 34 [Xyrichtys novacula]|uniref:Leucine-rich repeat-containing protein 34 n=1 Tax=Xyrichtys novacula TaxID=13765 RepID=A0AAV1HA30_XYRNO|nr:leucine-rich repeat-containing protein 34 [Xyrichtys novacula]